MIKNLKYEINNKNDYMNITKIPSIDHEKLEKIANEIRESFK